MNIDITLEEWGDLNLTVEASLDVKVYPGEPMVRYYADGSGYPGSPPEAELRNVHIEGVWHLTGDEIKLNKEWGMILEAALFEYLYNNPEVWEDTAFEEAEGRDDC